jgi:hypothetical protein
MAACLYQFIYSL